jgi:hypothetical protein
MTVHVPHQDRWQVGDARWARLAALGLPHHRVHDSRHFYAIRAIRAGTPYELVARGLGHTGIAIGPGGCHQPA